VEEAKRQTAERKADRHVMTSQATALDQLSRDVSLLVPFSISVFVRV